MRIWGKLDATGWNVQGLRNSWRRENQEHELGLWMMYGLFSH